MTSNLSGFTSPVSRKSALAFLFVTLSALPGCASVSPKSDAQLSEEVNAICSKPEYAVIFADTPCKATDITPKHFSNTSKITQEQKAAFPKYRQDLDAISNEQLEYARTRGTSVDKQWADYLESIQPVAHEYNQDLYNGAITWGDYNRRREALLEKMAAEWTRRTQQK